MVISLLRRGKDLSEIIKIHLSDISVQQERADSPGPSCVSLKSDWSMDHPSNFRDGNQSIEKRWGFIRYYTTISIRHPLILVLVFLEESRRREQTPLDPAVSPWRATGLWIFLLTLKMEAPPERRGRGFKQTSSFTDNSGNICVFGFV